MSANLTADRAGEADRESARIADDVETRAFRDLYDAAPAPLARNLGLAVETVGDGTVLRAARLPAPMFNRVIGLGLRRPAQDADIDALVAGYRSAGCRVWWLHASPFAEPSDLVARLRARGFAEPARRAWAKMLRGATPVADVSTPLRVGPVDDADADAAAAAAAIVRAFEMPPFVADWLAALHRRPGWRLYAAHDGDTVVGGAALFVDGRDAWLGMGAVLASHRRRAGQRALMARRIADAVSTGCDRIVTETGEPVGDEPNPSLANMRRFGFVQVASRLNLAGPA